ncbi:MAG: saccharopine dehydrogenase NADP-binding domain-containing protein, partial [Proteobacteria bacterium]|nr:saccharopine dehydrogenase NADP-binding domain-containing protein [Pseudomonadota bacterium]
MNNSDRKFDVIVWGATGFTGALVAEYLSHTYGVGQSLNWAIAGRDIAKLEALKAALGDSALPTVVADSFDVQTLDALAGRSKVILSTVGPYAKYGSALVAACVQAGTHYCDLAGEAQWIRQMIDQHHEAARESGARIVHCCGFDSVPMDMGVWFLQHEAQKQHGQYCDSISMLVKALKGGASGGTIASLLNVIRESRQDRAIARVVADPYGLNPQNERSGPDELDQQNVRKDAGTNMWTAPFIMAGINTKVVRRSHALAGYQYGRDFRYHEAMLTGKGFGGWLKANMVMLGLGALVFFASFDVTRSLLQRFGLPKPGEGPDENA